MTQNTQNIDNDCSTRKGVWGKYVIAIIIAVSVCSFAAYKFGFCMWCNNNSASASSSTISQGQNNTGKVYLVERNSFYNDLDQIIERMFNNMRYSSYIIDDIDNHRMIRRNSFNYSSTTEKSDANYTIKITIPGFDKEQINVTVKNNQLVVSATQNTLSRTQEEDSNIAEKDRQQLRNCFQRSLQIPYDIDQSAITSDLENGILTIILPRSPESDDVKKIEIN